jgi:hypothetical protein
MTTARWHHPSSSATMCGQPPSLGRPITEVEASRLMATKPVFVVGSGGYRASANTGRGERPQPCRGRRDRCFGRGVLLQLAGTRCTSWATCSPAKARALTGLGRAYLDLRRFEEDLP